MNTNSKTHYSLGLTGYPLSQSLSPVLQAAALKANGLQGEYRLYPIRPDPDGLEALEKLIDSIRDGCPEGLNVTIPHKQTVIPFLDELTPLARRIGAVNTIFRRDGKLIGDNTDAPAFKTDLSKQFTHSAKASTALVLGAGGSARAVVDALLGEGWHVIVAARRIEQGYEIIPGSEYKTEPCEVIGLGSLREFLWDHATFRLQGGEKSTYPLHPAIKLIANATPLGMFPNTEGSPWPDDLPFPPGAFVYDLVYNPLETRLVRLARSAGLEAAGGLGMLIEQAALAFERWTGIHPSREAMRQGIMTADGLVLNKEH